MLHYLVIYSMSERERMAVNMQETVSILARLKIVPTIKNLYTMPEHVDKLSSIVRVQLQQHFPDSY